MKKIFIVLFLVSVSLAALAGEPPQDFMQLAEHFRRAYQVIFGPEEADIFYGHHYLLPSNQEIRKQLEERLADLTQEPNQGEILQSIAVLYKLWPVENTATAEELYIAQQILAKLKLTTPEND